MPTDGCDREGEGKGKGKGKARVACDSFIPRRPRSVQVRVGVLAFALAFAMASAGCIDLVAARVPDRLLEGAGGNGWEKNFTASQREPTSEQNGLVKTQSLVYQDRQDPAYAGSLTVTTLRTLLAPNEDKLRATVQDRIAAEASAKGIRLQGGPETGSRRVATGATSSWFVYNGTVATSGFFAQSAQVKVFGEIFRCDAQKTEVVATGLASTTDVRTIGGIPIPSDPDYGTWSEIVGDPRGSVEGYRGSDGLAYNVACQ